MIYKDRKKKIEIRKETCNNKRGYRKVIETCRKYSKIQK